MRYGVFDGCSIAKSSNEGTDGNYAGVGTGAALDMEPIA